MKTYVLLGETDYEGDTLLAVFATLELAHEAIFRIGLSGGYFESKGRFDGYKVEEIEVRS